MARNKSYLTAKEKAELRQDLLRLDLIEEIIEVLSYNELNISQLQELKNKDLLWTIAELYQPRQLKVVNALDLLKQSNK